MKIAQKLWLLFLLICVPERFIAVAAQEDLSAGRSKKLEDSEKLSRERTRKIRTKQRNALFHIVWLGLAGYLLASILNSYISLTPGQVLVSRVAAVSIIAWAALARLGWEIQSMGGTTVAEQIHTFSFRFFYSLGVFFTVAALFLEPG